MTPRSADHDGGSGSDRSGDGAARPRPDTPGQPDQESRGGWGWFSKPLGSQDAGDQPADADHRTPSRPPTAIRPVGSGADRYRSQDRPHATEPAAPDRYRAPEPEPAAPASWYRAPEPDTSGAWYRASEPDSGPESGYGRDLAYGREVPRYGGAEDRGETQSRGSRHDDGRYESRYESRYDERPPESRYDESRYDTRRYDERRYEPVYEEGARYRAAPRPEPEPEPPAPRWAGRSAFSAPAPRPDDDFRREAPPAWGAAGSGRDAVSSVPEGGWFASDERAAEAGGARPDGPTPVPTAEAPAAPPVPSATPEPAVVDEPSGTASFGSDRDASPDAILIRRTMKVIEPVADKTTSYFYALLFLQHPELRELFPAAMDSQRDRLFRALLTAAKHVDDAETLTAYLANLGRGHRKYGTVPDHYPAVGECLIGALTRYASEIWNEEVEAAWVRAYTAISQIMIDAAAENQRVAPAWWQAEIISHERRTSDIAVITVRPDQPYPFLAGQYTSLETPWWPRVWRHYSFASAPRTDGLLSFHVRAVPAGWVSSAIVNRARPGDVVRLGPPAGSMTVDHDSDNGLLCLGGGTGIAPIKALVEDVAEHGRRRPVDVFYAARRDHDLYDLDTMLGMQQRHPWLSVRPVVSDVPVRDSGLEAGQLPEVVTRYGPWPAYEAYLSGPPGMIRSSVDALVGIGMPTNRIRHDSLEELVSARD